MTTGIYICFSHETLTWFHDKNAYEHTVLVAQDEAEMQARKSSHKNSIRHYNNVYLSNMSVCAPTQRYFYLINFKNQYIWICIFSPFLCKWSKATWDNVEVGIHNLEVGIDKQWSHGISLGPLVSSYLLRWTLHFPIGANEWMSVWCMVPYNGMMPHCIPSSHPVFVR